LLSTLAEPLAFLPAGTLAGTAVFFTSTLAIVLAGTLAPLTGVAGLTIFLATGLALIGATAFFATTTGFFGEDLAAGFLAADFLGGVFLGMKIN
jgi:hypothetical protein